MSDISLNCLPTSNTWYQNLSVIILDLQVSMFMSTSPCPCQCVRVHGYFLFLSVSCHLLYCIYGHVLVHFHATETKTRTLTLTLTWTQMWTASTWEGTLKLLTWTDIFLQDTGCSEIGLVRYQISDLKGTLARDFLLLFFFHQKHPLGPLIHTLNSFRI